MKQGSEEWLAARLGKVTASRVADLTARTKSGYSASRENYMAEIVAERLTGAPAAQYTNSAMQWGTDTEPKARAAYEFYRDMDVVETGFVVHPIIQMSGASPDGLVGDDGLVEIKCPNTATHIDTLLGQAVPGKYVKQMQWQMACTGRKWCDFVSYDPRLPENLRLFVRRVDKDDPLVVELGKEIVAFLAETDEKIIKLLRVATGETDNKKGDS
ncbi:MAG: YqaJ viral recombinase family protein [Methylomonas sp.]|nr:YqaJ viral recombinase family protein [Methylomonas sp.]